MIISQKVAAEFARNYNAILIESKQVSLIAYSISLSWGEEVGEADGFLGGIAGNEDIVYSRAGS